MPTSMENIYSLDGKVPLLKSVPFGLQHVLAMTKVINRYTIATGAGVLVLAGIFPTFGACGFGRRNITIAALSVSIGLGYT